MEHADGGKKLELTGSVSRVHPAPSESSSNAQKKQKQKQKKSKTKNKKNILAACRSLLPKEDDILKTYPPNNSVDVMDLKKSGYALPIVLFYHVAFLFLLLFFTVTNVQTRLGQRFLSLDGSSSSQTCIDIPLVVQGSYNADWFGKWSSSPDFLYNSTIYRLTLDGSNITNEQYRSTMNKFDANLKSISTKGASRDVVWNLIAWSSWQITDVGSRMSLYTTAEAGIVLSQFYAFDMFLAKQDATNKVTTCGDAVSFSISPTKLYLILTFGQYGQQCEEYLSVARDFNYNEQNEDSKPVIMMDIRSILLVIALNYGIIHLEDLEPTAMSNPQSDALLQAVGGKYYLDPFYPGNDDESLSLSSHFQHFTNHEP